MKENKISDNKNLKKRVKKLLMKAKKKELIKSHVIAFNDTPVTQEEHKGQIKAFR